MHQFEGGHNSLERPKLSLFCRLYATLIPVRKSFCRTVKSLTPWPASAFLMLLPLLDISLLDHIYFASSHSHSHENCNHGVYFPNGLAIPSFCRAFVVALFMILQWVYYPSFSTNIVTNYIYVFSTNL